MVSSDVVGIGSEYFVVYLSCVYIYCYSSVCSADYVELPVLLYQVSTLTFGISHAVQNEKKLWNLHTWYRVIGEVLVLGLLVVVCKIKIPYSRCM